MTGTWKRWGLAGLLIGAILPQGTQTAGAQTATSLSIGSATVAGSTITVAGSVAYGDDAAAPIQVAEDPMGDDADGGVIPQGTDIGNATIATDLVGKKLTFGIPVYDLPPTGKIAPGYVYAWSFSVEGNDEGRYLSAGTAGSWTGSAPIADPNGWFRLCQVTSGYSCPTQLTGTMGSGKVEIVLPFGQASIKPGYVIDVGGQICGSICATYNPTATILGSPNADSTSPSSYQLPGVVSLGVGPAGAPDASVSTPVKAGVTLLSGKVSGTFNGSVAKPATPGDYKVVAKTCFGNVESPVCFLTSTPLTVV